ncbi:Mth938-like domain-containing protein [candidate division KSB1 bacterium]
MKPVINDTTFGSITIEGKTFQHDVIISLNGDIKKRKKKLSKAIYGTSHVLSQDEAKFVYEKSAKQIIIGSGQNGILELSDEAKNFFKKKKCSIDLMPTPKAVKNWNELKDKAIGLFHVTC